MTPMRLRLGELFVGEQAEQVLRVARLVALVGQADPAFVAAGVFARGGRAARVAPAARGVVEHGVAVLGVVDVVVVERLVAVAGWAMLDSNEVLLPSQPWIITIVGNGPVPLAGSVTSASSGTPSNVGTRCASVSVGQKRTPFSALHACPNGAGSPAGFAFAAATPGNCEHRRDEQRQQHPHAPQIPSPHVAVVTRCGRFVNAGALHACHDRRSARRALRASARRLRRSRSRRTPDARRASARCAPSRVCTA